MNKPRKENYTIEDFVRFDITENKLITIGMHVYDTIQLENSNQGETSVSLILKDNVWHLLPSKDIEVICNTKKIVQEEKLHLGDVLDINDTIIIIQDTFFDIKLSPNAVTTLKSEGMTTSIYNSLYPNYRRSPRIIYQAPEDEIIIENPANKPAKPTEEIWKILVAPLTTLTTTVVMGLATGRGWIAYLGGLATIITSIVSLITFLKKRNTYKEELKELQDFYTKYLVEKTKEIKEQIQTHEKSLTYHLPNIIEITQLVESMSNRIYEKMMHHPDFLQYRIGMMETELSFDVKYSINELNNKQDELEQTVNDIKQTYDKKILLPYGITLNHGAVGYVGARPLILEQLQLMMLQLATFHSYHDLSFITIFPESEKNDWEFARWLPHSKINAINMRSFIYHERSRDQVLSSFYQILKERKQVLAENKEARFAPHYVMYITASELISDHSIMELITDDIKHLGVTLVYISEHIESLPEFVKTVIQIKDNKEGILVLENEKHQNKKFMLDHFQPDFNKETISRTLAPLVHELTLINNIPESVTFLEMYNVNQIEELKVTQRWSTNAPHKSLAVPLGVRGKDDIVYLNLHEKAHGPHGLVAGTTGSGKSEIIQSYILSLAINFHPYDIAFLLIDYKGGGMANLFKHLPHHLGSITNLDGAQSMRALISIKAELQRRQRLFSENDVNHINQYQKLFKEQKVVEPMPHLFLISDEFAELKAEQPEFMKELVSTARIGRSLGIHLILATQKPSGVVDDQIWSNSKFKLCLKVQNAADSNEMLKTPDAANITLPGRSYLQVGNNEIYELFQSAWSGADYHPNTDNAAYVDDTIYRINELGQYEILSEDLSGLENQTTIQKFDTELDSIISYLDNLIQLEGIEKLSQPWLPPLETQQVAPIVDFQTTWSTEKLPMEIEVGVLDQPHIQAQNPFFINLNKNGHMLVVSSPGYGKSTTLQTSMMQLARRHSPEHLHTYLLDFGTNGLLALQDLPHVADLMQIDDEEKISKFIRLILSEIKQRKSMLSEYSVASLSQYEQAANNVLPYIVIVIDNMDAIRDAELPEEFDQMLNQIGREGASLGIHLLLSATRENSVRMQLMSNLKIKLAQYLIDPSEVTAIVGRSDFTIEELPGRGLVKLDTPTLFQMGMPAIGDDVLSIINNIKTEANNMSTFFTGKKPQSIPMVPEVLSYEEFIQLESTHVTLHFNQQIAIGLDLESVETVKCDLTTGPLVCMTDTIDKTKKITEIILQQVLLKNFTDLIIIDSKQQHLQKYSSNEQTSYVTEITQIDTAVDKLIKEFEMRQNSNSKIYSSQFYVLNNLTYLFDDMSSTLQDKLLEVLQMGNQYNMNFIMVGEHTMINRSYSLKQIFKELEVLILMMKAGDQSLISTDIKTYTEPKLLSDEAYFVKQGQAIKIKTPVVL